MFQTEALKLLSLEQDEHLHKTSVTEFKGKHIKKERKERKYIQFENF